MTSIGNRAFSGCGSLTYVEYWGTGNPSSSVAFAATVPVIYVTDDYADDRCSGRPVSVKYFTVNAAAEPAGWGRISGLPDGKVEASASVKLKAIPVVGYRFAGRTEDGETLCADQKYVFTMPAGTVNLQAVFEVSPPEISGVSITVDGKTHTSGRVIITSGSTVSVTLEGHSLVNLDGSWNLRYAPGKEIRIDPDGWTVSADGTAAACDLTDRIADFSACREFELTYTVGDDADAVDTGICLSYGYPVTVTASGSGTASVSVEAAAAGDEVILSASPDAGHKLTRWHAVSGGVTVENDAFIMPEERVELQAVFAEAPDPAVITGVTITVDGTRYTSGRVVIYPDSTVMVSVIGTDLVNLDGENYYLNHRPHKAVRVAGKNHNGSWTVSADGTTAICDFTRFNAPFF